MTPTFSQREILRSLAGIHPATAPELRARVGVPDRALRSQLWDLLRLGAVRCAVSELPGLGRGLRYRLTVRGLHWSMSDAPNASTVR